MRLKKLQIAAVLLISFNPLRSPAATDSLPNFDKRLEQAKANQLAVVNAAKENAASVIRNRVKDVRIDTDEILGSPKFVASTAEFLTGTNGSGGAVSAATAAAFPANDPHRGVKMFLTEHKALFGFGPEALAAAKVNKDYVSAPGNFRTVVWQQHVDDIPVFDGIFKAHLTKNGELINVGSRFVPDLQPALDKIANRTSLQTNPPISVHRAIVLAAENLGDVLATNLLTTQDAPQGNEKFQHFRGSPVLNNTSARLTWLPLDSSTLRLCWDINVESRARGELYRVIVDATTGEVWRRQCLTDNLSDIEMNVWTGESPSPMSPTLSSVSSYQPPVVPRTLVTFSALDTNASPAGWINDGDNTTVGNNVDAHLDWNNDNTNDPGSHPAGSPNRVFSYVIDSTQAPSNNWAVAVVSLFYWNNWAHDKFYEYGFTEAAGNFQTDNFGRGGAGGDPVQADGQDSYMLAASGTTRNNANFSTPVDGSSPRMQMYIFNGPSPNRDDDVDATMMLHEYTHGVSSRLVGGGGGISALQPSGMGEGWSDFCALSLLSNPTNDPDANYAVSSYVTYNYYGLTNNYYFGLRRYPYSVNTNINPLTYKDIDTNQISAHAGVPFNPVWGFIRTNANEVHMMGEVWCVTLWEARSRLCHKYGNAAGNQMMLQLVIDGMKLSPANPLFLQARNAILQADLVDNGGANQDLLWAAFAKRGMGYSASSPPNFTTLGVGEAFNTPADTNAPILAVTSPANNSVLMLFTNISGTAYDGGSGLEGNQIHFTLYNNGNFWSGSYWTNKPPPDPSIDLTASVVSGAWTFTNVPTGGAQVQGLYYVNAFARDNAGNLSTPQPGVNSISFTIDTSPPNVAITFPPNGSTITNQPGGNWFQGTASDDPGNHLSLTLFIRRNSDNLYWTGSGWGDVTNGFISNSYNSGNQTWQSTGTLPVPGSSLGNGDYHFIAIAVDAAGNTQQVDSVVSVDFHPVFVFNHGSQSGLTPNMNWSDPANWDVGSVPTPDARVIINNYSPDYAGPGSLQLYRLDMSGGSLTTAGMLIQKLNLSGGTLTGGTITITTDGIFNWSGGTLAGSYNVPADATLNITGSADKTLSTATLLNNGTVIWNGGNILASYHSAITNNATFVVQSSGLLSNNAVGSGSGLPLPVFVNNGSFQKTNSNGYTTIAADYGGWAFIQNGTIDVENGALSSLSQFYVNGGAVFAGPGETRVDGGIIVINGTNTIQAGATVELGGGTWFGTNIFAGTGAFNWSGGTIAARLNLQAGIGFSISGNNDKTLAQRSGLTFAGSGSWTGTGKINAAFTSVITNDGTFTVQNDSSYLNSADGYGQSLPLPLFVNNGSLVKNITTGATVFDFNYGGVAFNNNGTVNIQSGVISLGGGGAGSNGIFTAAFGSHIDLFAGGHSLTGNLTFSGAGSTRVNGGALTFGNSLSTMTAGGTFEVMSGSAGGTNTFAGTGNFNWSGGTIAARLNLQANIGFNISGSTDKTLAQHGDITIAGSGSWTGTGKINAAFTSVVTNNGTFTVQNDSSYLNSSDGYGQSLSLPLFVNNGSLVKTNSSNTTLFDFNYGGVAFNNNGTVNIQSGVISLGGGGAGSNGIFTAASGSHIDLFAGGHSLTGNLTFSGAGSTRVNGGALTFGNSVSTMTAGGTFEVMSGSAGGTNTFAGTGNFNWSGGTIAAMLTLQPNIALNITGDNEKTLGGGSFFGILKSAGPGTWTGAGHITCSFASILQNDGTFTVRNDSVFDNNAGGYGGVQPLPVFVNNGTFRKNTMTGPTVFTSNYGGVTFSNNGTVDLQTGTLAINGSYTLSGSPQLKLALGGINPGTQFSQENFAGAATLGGILSVTLTNGFMPTNGQSFAIVNYASRTGQFTSTQFPTLPIESKWKLTYDVNSLLVQVVPANSNLFQNLSLTNNGNFQFSFLGETGSACLIEASTNLVNWDPLLTNSPFNGSLNFVDPQTTQFPQRFYRATIFP